MSDPGSTEAARRHGAWIEIDQAALVHNARVLRRAIPPSARLGLLVKANGYGHGLEVAARAALAGGADQLIVANLAEGLALRAAGIEAPVFVAYPVAPDALGDAVRARLELTVSGVDQGRRLLEAWRDESARPAAGELRLHVEVDTGMGRGGIAPTALVEFAEAIEATAGVTLEGVWSHLADGTDAAWTGEQVTRFEAATAALAATGRNVPTRHLVATEGLFAATAPVLDLARIGLAFYGELGLGVEPASSMAAFAAELRLAMAVKARAIRVETIPAGASVGYGGEWTAGRPSLIGTLPIGYADGWTRASWPGAQALVRGRRVPLVGRVSMDSVCADVTDVGPVRPDEEFVLLGGQGTDRISPNELAAIRRSIPNEVFCAFGPRLPRVVIAAPGLR